MHGVSGAFGHPAATRKEMKWTAQMGRASTAQRGETDCANPFALAVNVLSCCECRQKPSRNDSSQSARRPNSPIASTTREVRKIAGMDCVALDFVASSTSCSSFARPSTSESASQGLGLEFDKTSHGNSISLTCNESPRTRCTIACSVQQRTMGMAVRLCGRPVA